MPSPITSPSASRGAAGAPGAHAGALDRLLAEHPADPAVAALRARLRGATTADDLIGLQRDAMQVFERGLPAQGYADAALARYQRLCRAHEALLAERGDDQRFRVLVIVPTADRPRQLRECLASLLELCRRYGYGGSRDGRYLKVAAMIADDSRAPASLSAHRELAREFAALGLETTYFGLEAQRAELGRLPGALRARLDGILGNHDPEAFFHKGHSVMRNILYLHLQRRYGDDPRQLFYFADSDQEFRVKIGDRDGDRDLYALNYFQQLDRLFTDHDIEILTGKVVGDPPVSPAVMAGNFLDDVQAFLERVAQVAPGTPCPFHGEARPQGEGAAYHDMAGLFGFAPGAAHSYRCTLHGTHSVADGLEDFTRKLSRFFDGEHPTRITYFDAAEALYREAPIQPARTVYTGNYVIRASALRHFVPFAPLRLRMSGPTFGRLLKAQLGAGFVSANLPMLHKRTEPETGASEFRPGVIRDAERVDLSNEFERQFFGDVMLFSVERLTALGFPAAPVEAGAVAQILAETAARMRALYGETHAGILARLATLRRLRAELGPRFAEAGPAWARLDAFLDNMDHNFGARAEGYRLIEDAGHRAARLVQLRDAVVAYRDDADAWRAALAAVRSAPARP